MNRVIRQTNWGIIGSVFAFAIGFFLVASSCTRNGFTARSAASMPEHIAEPINTTSTRIPKKRRLGLML